MVHIRIVECPAPNITISKNPKNKQQTQTTSSAVKKQERNKIRKTNRKKRNQTLKFQKSNSALVMIYDQAKQTHREEVQRSKSKESKRVRHTLKS